MYMLGTQALLAEEMVAIEWNSEYLGFSRLLMMENAGQAVAAEILKRYKKLPTVAIFAGLGGNGGDGFVAARHLAPRCRTVHLALLGDPSLIRNAPAARNWKIVEKMRHSIETTIVHDISELPDFMPMVVVDALLGTGVKGAPRKPILRTIRLMNKLDSFKVAIDVPTGIHPDTGDPTIKSPFRADLTVTFHRPKQGLSDKNEYVGKLVVADIGIPPEAELYVGPGDVFRAIKPRSPLTKKGDYGRLLIIGGSPDYIGAPILASIGALRSGADLVYLAAPSNVITAATSKIPDLIPITLQDKKLTINDLPLIDDILTNVDVLLIGPGLGDNHETLDTVGKVLSIADKYKKPVVIDADALKVISRAMDLSSNIIITPHAGEMQRIAGYSVATPLTHRAQQVRDLAKKLKCVVLLKGAVDIISTQSETRFNWTGTPAMSVGGTGDVLAGLVTGFLAQGLDSFLAGCVGAFVNGAAGSLAYRDKGTGLIAFDLSDYIPKVLSDPMSSPITYNLRIPFIEE
jgi:hydroxyethylthiazole kinase-like uncharacterized protein yjeF